MSLAVTISSPPSSSSLSQSKIHSFNHHPKFNIQFFSSKSPLRASRRSISNTTNTSNLINDPRNWGRSINTSELFDDGNDDDEEEEEEEEDRSLDLFVRFIQNVFKKVSKRARKAARSVLPLSISTKLVGFSVNGVLILAFLWVLKAFLEVVCTLGSVVFVSILLIRGIWSGITYLQESRYLELNEVEDEHHEWTGAQPAT
ncbi:conserved hypothetical protein [Ricinus communis]|uniref:Uncharacterized protein n=1 Tax=Ricinus communis TaxID=3988 RepID=B9S7Y9_RICCO|nr:conserved hypothetical protein [Ricinus communis]|eukprot:XP_002522105.1 protein SHORT HYPOCOTYL IN WHITE LIGHT 1 [Ricinus communis]